MNFTGFFDIKGCNQISILLLKYVNRKHGLWSYFQLTSTIQASKMENSSIKKLLKALEWSLFIVMIIAAALFVNKSFQNYQSNATGVQVLSQIVDLYDAPTMTICFEPNKKSTILQQYDIQDYSWKPPDVSKYNTTWPLVYQELSFRIGRDFNLTIVLDGNGRQEMLTINNMSLTENALKAMEFEEIITIGSGICSSVTLKSKMSKGQTNQIVIQFNESLPLKDIPKMIEVTFTSKQNSYGIISNFWKEGKECQFLIDREKKGYNMIALQLSQHKKLDASPSCSNDAFYWNCLSKR